MQTDYPQSQFVGYLAAVLLVVCVLVALFAVTVSLTSGSTEHVAANVTAAPATSAG